MVEAGGVPVLIRLLQSDIELAEQCVWALGNIGLLLLFLVVVVVNVVVLL